MTPHTRRLFRDRSTLYAACAVTLNLACLPAVERLLSQPPSEPDAKASEVIPSLLYAYSGGRIK